MPIAILHDMFLTIPATINSNSICDAVEVT